MKKLLIGLSIATLSNMSLASERTGFYLKATVGANKMNEAEDEVKNKVVTSKSEISPSFSVGIGGYINDFIRTDLTFDYSKVNFKNATTNITTNGFDEDDGNYTMSGDASIDRNASVYSMMLNNYIDLPMNDNSKIFIGGGVGLASIKEKIIAKLKRKIYVGNDLNSPHFGTQKSHFSIHQICFGFELLSI
jgi:opacity protein-like surface antigen